MPISGTILVVDDHRDLAENLAEILEDAGYEAIIAESAEAALERIACQPIVALITDYRLPGRSGAELIAELRRRGRDLPAIVMSAFTDDETIATSRQAGAMEVLPKPVELLRLFRWVVALGAKDAWVLIVDDDERMADNLAEAIAAEGHRVEIKACARGTEFLASSPAAAIIDYRLPDGTGLEVAERLIARNPATRILFVSGHVDDLERGLSGRLSHVDRLEKPVEVARLLHWVAEAMAEQTRG